jgi:hypothetical protein
MKYIGHHDGPTSFSPSLQQVGAMCFGPIKGMAFSFLYKNQEYRKFVKSGYVSNA